MPLDLHFPRAAVAATAVACLGIAPLAVGAEASGEDPTGLAPDGRPGLDRPAESREWSAALGIGAAYGPEFEGARTRETSAFPVVNARWRRFGLDSATLRYYFIEGSRATLTAGIGYDGGRADDADDDRLRGLGEIEGGGTAVVTGSYALGAVTLSANFTRLLAGSDGTRAEVGLSMPVLRSTRMGLTAYVGARWANADYMQAYYGVTRQQSLASRLPTYDAGSGLVAWGGMLHGHYELNARWSAFARVGVGQLAGDAKDSPVTGRTSQVSALFGAAYAF